MRIVLILLGLAAALLALFSGGCSLAFGIGMFLDGRLGDGTWMAPAAGLAAAAGLGWLAWFLLRRLPAPPVRPRDDD